MNEKVLFVAYYFPPDAAVGALRTQKFVKYLPEHGWQPFVLTLQERYYTVLDSKRLEDVNGAVIERTSFWRTPLQLFIDIRDNHFRPGGSQCSQSCQAAPKPVLKNAETVPYVKRFLAGLNSFPDDKLYWLIPGLIKGVRLIKKNGIRIIVVSAPPHSTIILSYLLALWTASRLVVDFRDPWCLAGVWNQRASFKPDVLLSAENAMQTRILKRSSAVLTTNEYCRNALLRENPYLLADKVHVLQNGFDSSDFPPRSKNIICSGAKYIVSYLGTFYMQRTPEKFLKALSIFMREKGLHENNVEVRFIGNVEHADGIPVARMIEDAGMENVVKMTGHVTYSKALRLMRESSLLLLLAPDQPYQIPAKTYEYLAAGCPILALTEPGATASLIEESHCGLSVDPHDIQGMILAFHRLYDDFLHGGRSFVCDASQFERRNQAAKLATILGQVAVQAHHSNG